MGKRGAKGKSRGLEVLPSFGYAGLAVAIVWRAILDARKGDADARRWLDGEDDDALLSVRDCLGHLGDSAELVDRWLKLKAGKATTD